MVANTAWSLFNFRNGLIRHLQAEGYQITILSPHDDFSEKLAALGCTVLDLPMSAKGVNPVEDIRLTRYLRETYRTLRPDFILHYTIKPNIYGSIAAHLAGIPSIAITTGLGYTFVNDNLVARIARHLYKFAFRFPQEVWFLNEDDRQTFLHYGLVSRDKAVLLHGEGVDLQHFTPRHNAPSDDKFRFLLIARMLWDKGVGEYTEAARMVRAHYPNAVFQLLGDCGVPNPSVIGREQIAEWEREGLVEYLGTTDDVRPVIAQADCLVLPSYREGIPRTMIESAAMAKPLIVSDAPGCRDVVRNGITGYLCPVKDAKELADCCQRMLELPTQERVQMGVAGRALMAEVFDEQKVITQYMATLHKYGILPKPSPHLLTASHS